MMTVLLIGGSASILTAIIGTLLLAAVSVPGSSATLPGFTRGIFGTAVGATYRFTPDTQAGFTLGGA